MATSRLNLIVTFPMAMGIPTIQSDIKPERWVEVLEGFIACQIGAGADTTPPVQRDVYRIHVQLDLEDDDTYYCAHDCGNKGLRDGILLDTFQKIEAGLAVHDKS